MNTPKLIVALKYVERIAITKEECKKQFSELTNILLNAIQEVEIFINSKNNAVTTTKLKLCLSQLHYTINKLSDLLRCSESLKSMLVVKLLVRKICLCLKETINVINEEESIDSTDQDLSYHMIISRILSALYLPDLPDNIDNLIDNLLCSSLTIAKLSDQNDFKEISACCKNILTTLSSEKENREVKGGLEHYHDSNFLLYQVKLLERKVNTAMLRLLLHIMSYPQESLKVLIKRSGCTSKAEKYSEDLDDEIAEFDLTCDRIALIGNFAIKSCEQESMKIKVQNCLANLEFCEESLVPSCIDYYLEPNSEKREFLKYLSGEWKCEVRKLSLLLDTIVDPAAFSLVVFDDLLYLIQNIKSSESSESGILYQRFYQRCLKFIDSISKSPDKLGDSFIIGLKKSLISELKKNEIKYLKNNDSEGRIRHLEVTLSLVDQISEYLNRILNCSNSDDTGDITYSTLTNVSFKDTSIETSKKNSISSKWDKTYDNAGALLNNHLVPNMYLKKAQMCSPFVCTMYKKTPLRKKVRDNVALSLDLSEYLNRSSEA